MTMKTNQKTFTKYFSLAALLLFLSPVFITNQSIAQTKNDYKVLEIKTEIDEGKDKEVKVLFEGERIKFVQLTLRNGMSLKSHSAEEPSTIQCVAGNGELIIGQGENSETIRLHPGVFVTLDANVLHDVIAKSSVSILLIRFPDK
jgi:quercetin dioxygenase-like cupin family protein